MTGLVTAVAKKDLRAISAFNPMGFGGEMDRPLLQCLLQVCGYLWASFRQTPFGSEVLNQLIRYCEQLKGRSYLKLWKAYNLVLTALAAETFGLYSDKLHFLRRINFQMQFKDIVTSSPMDFKREELFQDYEQFIRNGLAVQAWLDFRGGVALGEVQLTDVIVVAQGLVEGPGLYHKEWLLFLEKASESGGARLDDLQANDLTDRVLKPLTMLLRLADGDMEEHVLTVWTRILWSMPFVALVKVVRCLFDQTSSPSQLVFLLNTTRGHISNWLKSGAEDAAAMMQLRELLRDLYNSGKLSIPQNEAEHTNSQLQLVLHAIRLYVLIVMTVVRGSLKHQELVLETSECMAARGWLLRLQEQLSTAQIGGFLKSDYQYAGKVVAMGLLLNKAPQEYPYGVPL